jgi:hypothetical protein
MNEQEFAELFGTRAKDGNRRPKVDAATGQPLQKSDNPTRYKVTGTAFYVLATAPLSEEQLQELGKAAKAGPKTEKAAKAPAKDEA